MVSMAMDLVEYKCLRCGEYMYLNEDKAPTSIEGERESDIACPRCLAFSLKRTGRHVLRGDRV